MRVKTCRNQNPLGLKFFRSRDDDMLKDFHIFTIGAAGRQRNVERISRASAGANFVDRAGARIERILMRRNEQHGWVFVKRILRAVTMMDVPIHDENLFHAVLMFQIRRANRHGIKQTKTHRSIWQSMMAGRTHQGKTAGAFLCRNTIEQRKKTSRCEHADRKGIPAGNRVSIQGVVIDGRGRLH